MTVDHLIDNPLSNDDVMALLKKHGPGFASEHTQEAISAARYLIRQHAHALDTLGMTKVAGDLLMALAHLEPIPRLVSAAYGACLAEQLSMQRRETSRLIAVGFSRCDDPDLRKMAVDLAEHMGSDDGTADHVPCSRE